MKSVRNLFVMTVVLTLALTMAATSAFAIPNFKIVNATPVTVGSTARNVILLQGVGDSLLANDVLIAVRLKSCIQSEFAVDTLIVIKKTGATETTAATRPINSSFEEDSLLYISGLSVPFTTGDTLIFKVHINTDSTVAHAVDYHNTGLELSILPDGIDVDTVGGGALSSLSNRKSDGTIGTGGYGHNFNFQPVSCTGPYTATFNLVGPNFTFTGGIFESTPPCNALTVFNIGDSLTVNLSTFDTDVKWSTIRVDLSAFGLGNNVTLTAWDTLVAPYTIDTAFVIPAGNIDIIYPFSIGLTSDDTYGNSSANTYVFNSQYIDNIGPVVDSMKFSILTNNVGPSTSAAVGDELVLWVYTSSNGFFEVANVNADISDFFNAGHTAVAMTDVTSGAGYWRLVFTLTDEMAKDLAAGNNTAKNALVTVVDNGCNPKIDSVFFDPALDLQPPSVAVGNMSYRTILDADLSGCTNLGDSLYIQADVSGNNDLTDVWSDFLNGGLNGSSTQALASVGSNIWRARFKVGTADNPANDPNVELAKDGNDYPFDAIYRVWVFFEDDAGNVDSTLSNPLLNTTGTAAVPLDTRRPDPIMADSVSVIRLPGGALELQWNSVAQAGDATNFYIYVDSTGDPFNYNNVFGTTFDGEFDPTYNRWFSGTLTHGKTYRFSIRTQDDCGNKEFNDNIFEGIPDAQPAVICPIFPTAGGQYGPNNPLTLTATTTDADVASAWVVYRLKDQGDGSPGPWQNNPPGFYMTDNGQTFFQTLNLGSAPGTAGVWQLLILSADDVGNVQTLAGALAGCESYYEFTWNPVQPVCDILEINGAFAPQTSCGFNVTRDSMNQAIVSIVNPAAGAFYTIDTRVIWDTYKKRVDYAVSQTLPYTFKFSAEDWPKTVGGPLNTRIIVHITDERSGNFCETEVPLCVPDLIAPKAFISYPDGYSCVPIVRPAGDPIEVQVDLDPTGYDVNDAVRAELFYSLDGTLPGTKIGENSFGGNDYTVINWNNSGLSEGYVWLYAIVWDQVNNSYTTPFVKVCLDGTLPEMQLKVKGAVQYSCNGLDKWRVAYDLETPIFLSAELTNLNNIDIDQVRFYYQRVGDPSVVDIFYFWTLLGDGVPANNNSIWTYEWNSADVSCGYDYRIRVAVKDKAGNWMLDMDGDGNFDDYTFDDAVANNAGMTIYFDCAGPQPAISLFETNGTEGTRNWLNPSTLYGGGGNVYAKPGETITANVMTLPADDSCEVAKVQYFMCDKFVGESSDPSNFWQITFDPLAMGVYTMEDVADGYHNCNLNVKMWSKLGQTDDDEITVYILDNVPAHALITAPGEGAYVCGETFVNLATFDHSHLKRVTWYYWPAAGGPQVKIADVWGPDFGGDPGRGSSNCWSAYWEIAKDAPPDGDYYVGAELCDISENITPATESRNLVHVACDRPSVTVTSPSDGAFFCNGQVFTASVTNPTTAAPVDYVSFEYKRATSSNWHSFCNSLDNFAPWEFAFDNSCEELSDGFYNVRAVVYNKAGITVYGPTITLFYDGTSPRVSFVSVTDGSTPKDLEDENDPTVTYPAGTNLLTFTVFASDEYSELGTGPTYNSGIDKVCFYYTTNGGPNSSEMCFDATPGANGQVDIPWNISGLADGTYKLYFVAYDKVGCNTSSITATLILNDQTPPYGLIAGCWNGGIFGLTEANSKVQFQYRQGAGAWIPIGIVRQVDYEWLDNYQIYYYAYMADWKPADGDYEIRMLAADTHDNFNESYSPILSVTVANGICTVTSNPEDFGPGTIERNLENGCDNPEGIARINSPYGLPYGLAVAYNVSYQSWSVDIVPFVALPQQNHTINYGGDFGFWELTDDGYGWGHVFFFDYVNTTAYSVEQDFQTYWLHRDFGSGGPITYSDGSVIIDVPAEWVDYNATDGNALLIWKSKVARPSIYQDWVLTPVGDNNHMMTYITDPACDEESGSCGDDNQYAIVDMQYDNANTLPGESLMVAWWDGEGNWKTDHVFFPSTVRGFHKEGTQNWVEFAVTCFGDGDDAWYAVVKPTPVSGYHVVTRAGMTPGCGNYTDPFPTFYYQFSEVFKNTIDWSSLEVRFDGIRISADQYCYDCSSRKHVARVKSATDDANFWEIEIDPVAARVTVEYIRPGSPDSDPEGDPSDVNPPMACGDHKIWIGAQDIQGRWQYLEDPFVVDCYAPHVVFPNYYDSKNPSITFTATDDVSGVDWNNIYADVYFIAKPDTATGSSHNLERFRYAQTFFPGQIVNYRLNDTSNAVKITTHYELNDERAILVILYGGTRSYQPTTTDNYSSSDVYGWYGTSDGITDCVGNHASPQEQILAIDYDAPVIAPSTQTGSCPMLFVITDDGSGFTAANIEIFENGVKLTGESQSKASDVDAAGEWYFAAAGEGGTLYYCPTSGVQYEVRVTDGAGNVRSFFGDSGGSLGSDGLTDNWMGPNPFDPKIEQGSIHFKLAGAANVSIKIYDMSGQLVTTLQSGGSMGAGGHEVPWKGTTDGGTMVANGVYLAHIEASGNQGGSSSAVVKIAVVEK